MKKYQVTVSKQMHATLADGARSTGKSMAEFTDMVLRAKIDGKLPLAEDPGNLQELVHSKRSKEGHLLSPDGNYIHYDTMDAWYRQKSS